MKNTKLKQLLSIEFISFVFIAGIHLMLLEYLLPEIYTQTKLIYIYAFLLPLSILGTIGIFAISKNDDSLIGKGFLVFTMLKIFGSLTFLLPFILNQDESTRPFIYQFFGIFFPSLFIETIIILKMVNFIDNENKENSENL